MSFFRALMGFPARAYHHVPLALRVALIVSAVIVVSQWVTIMLLRNAGSVAVLRAGPDFGPVKPPPRFMQEPGFGVGPEPLSWAERDAADWLAPRAAQSGAVSLLEKDGDAHKLTFSRNHPGPPWPILTSVFTVTTLIVWIAAWWLMRPLAKLSRAAERLGRDVDSQPLAERGPPEIRRAAAAFNRMQDRLLRFIHGRADALLAMSHDLKTPITRLQLRVALLPEDQQTQIAEDVGVLQKRVDDALTFMRGVHTEEPLQEVDVNALASLVVERLQDTGADVELSGSTASLRCRPVALERALENVIENAVRYAGQARLRLVDSDDMLDLVIEDDGPGIPETVIGRATEPFFRVEASRSRDSGGTGLGLAITKDLIESMGGELRLGNRPQGGLEVCLSLPRSIP